MKIQLPPSVAALNKTTLAKLDERQQEQGRRGRIAKKNGDSFEELVQRELLALEYVRDITRCDAKVHATGDTVLYREASGCDFIGITKGGIGFAIECKSTRARAVFADKQQAIATRADRAPHITQRQREQLDAYASASVALLAIRFGDVVRVYPWSRVRKLSQITRETAGWHKCIADSLAWCLNNPPV